jgi:small subunit ribosomal protein S18
MAYQQKRFQRRKFCRFCSEKTEFIDIRYQAFRNYLTERGKILSRRMTGPAQASEGFVQAIMRSRNIALLSFER